MAPKRARKNYIGFIMAAEKNRKLTEDFFSKKKKPAKELLGFFHDEGFTEIELEHCRQIKKMMKPFPRAINAGDSPCPPNTHY